jgi:hypothetical protein
LAPQLMALASAILLAISPVGFLRGAYWLVQRTGASREDILDSGNAFTRPALLVIADGVALQDLTAPDRWKANIVFWVGRFIGLSGSALTLAVLINRS